MVIGCALGMSITAQAQVEQTSSVLNGSGGISAAGSVAHYSSSAQPGVIGASSHGALVHQAGFLNSFLLQPALDSDGDGLANELDLDNDGDQLADAIEISGVSFSPATPTGVNLADTDGDEVSDGAEAAAGTDPTDPFSVFEIYGKQHPDGNQILWTARGGKTYILRAATNLIAGDFTPLVTNIAVGGAAPWYVVTNSFVDASIRPVDFYSVEVVP